MAFLSSICERGGQDLLRDLAEAVLQKMMDFDVENMVGAGRYERSDARTTQRIGRTHPFGVAAIRPDSSAPPRAAFRPPATVALNFYGSTPLTIFVRQRSPHARRSPRQISSGENPL